MRVVSVMERNTGGWDDRIACAVKQDGGWGDLSERVACEQRPEGRRGVGVARILGEECSTEVRE